MLDILACPKCGRQYDVTHVASRRHIRCECGARAMVYKQSPNSPGTFNCWCCGGPFEKSAQNCAYCGSSITLEERHLDALCPKCFAWISSNANYCMECGTTIDSVRPVAIDEDSSCPRCKCKLFGRAVGNYSFTECVACAGIWLAAGLLERICDEAETTSTMTDWLATRPAPLMDHPSGAVVYLPCLECHDLMERHNFGGGSGVIYDICKGHGVWLDHGELEKIVKYARIMARKPVKQVVRE
ncbi:MAG: zf-TFIIB domain-containing protein [Planctomycetes bacterium]|nr:zf-TFIIB domain-containing protein [Planctomycetota bacterium]